MNRKFSRKEYEAMMEKGHKEAKECWESDEGKKSQLRLNEQEKSLPPA